MRLGDFGTGSEVPTRLLYSSHSLEDVIYRAELDRLAGQANGLEVFHTLTRSRPGTWKGYARRIDRDMLAQLAFSPEQQPLSMVCGPTPLVESVAQTLVDLGHAAAGMMREVFVQDVSAACGACASCGAIAQMGSQHAYMYSLSPGAVLRCKTCQAVLMVFVHAGGRCRLALGGLTWLEIEDWLEPPTVS